MITQVEPPHFHPSSFRLHPCSSGLLDFQEGEVINYRETVSSILFNPITQSNYHFVKE
jgi:hypothetical protein